MGVGLLVQQKFTTSDASQAAFTKMMPILFTVLFYNFASGLVIYWLVNTILSVAQQYYIHRGPSTVTDSPGDAAALDGVRASAPASVTAVPAFDAEEAEVVEDAPAPPSNGQGGKKNRRRRRRKKK
jgi:membrane protein insertase Oxa1/YidC/SpoIIIJ